MFKFIPFSRSKRESTGTKRNRVARRIGLGVLAVSGTLAVLGLACASYEAISAASDSERYPALGQLVDVGGFQMHINCTGEGTPTIVLDAGATGSSLDWNLVQPALSESTRVCSYDRAGMGWSESSPEPRTPEQVARELHTLLTNASVPGPYVLVGHSLGGKNVRMFTIQHPDDVVGMVLVDARSEYVDEMTSAAEVDDFHQTLSMQGHIYAIGRTFGVARILGATLFGAPPMSHDTRTLMALLATKSSAVKASSNELRQRASSDQLLHGASLGDRPLVVLASGDNVESLAFWPEGQQAQARLSTDGRLVVVEGSGHNIHWDQPSVVIDAVREVLSKGRMNSEARPE
jgi:pimeloyl-ACP methyl ester carboxylesterase